MVSNGPYKHRRRDLDNRDEIFEMVNRELAFSAETFDRWLPHDDPRFQFR